MEELEAALGEFAAIVDDLDKTTAWPLKRPPTSGVSSRLKRVRRPTP